MEKNDKDILSDIAGYAPDADRAEEEKEELHDEFAALRNILEQQPQKKAPAVPVHQGNVHHGAHDRSGAAAPRRPARKDARYSMSGAEIETLAAAAEDSVANGRFGAALDSVFFTAGPAREALAGKLNIRIPIGSDDTDLPVIATAALIESYLEHENINGDDIVEKLRLIIESSEDENGVCPTAEQVELRVFECVVIMCVQAEQCGNHSEIKYRLYEGDHSFLRSYLNRNVDGMIKKHRRDVYSFYNSVMMQSNDVSRIFGEYLSATKSATPFPVRFFAESTPVLVTAIVAAVLCIIAIAVYISSYGSVMSFIATDSFLMTLVVVLEVLFCGCLAGLTWLIYTSGEDKQNDGRG